MATVECANLESVIRHESAIARQTKLLTRVDFGRKIFIEEED